MLGGRLVVLSRPDSSRFSFLSPTYFEPTMLNA
jgi:hypothetical protein